MSRAETTVGGSLSKREFLIRAGGLSLFLGSPFVTSILLPTSEGEKNSLTKPSKTATYPKPVERLGMASHIYNKKDKGEITKELDLIREVGATSVRTDFEWGRMEPSKDSWDFSRYEFIVNEANKRGIDVIALLITNAAPKWKESDYDKRIISADDYANFARIVAKRFKGQIPRYEIGNEPNLDYAQFDVRSYSEYLVAAQKAITHEDPNATIISGGISSEGDTRKWVTEMYKYGGRPHYLGVHPYSQPNGPQNDRFSAISDFYTISQQQVPDGDRNKTKGVTITEIGWPTGTSSDGAVSEDQQAVDLTQVFQRVKKEMSFVNKVCVYQMRNEGDDIKRSEKNFGLVTYDLSRRKPAFAAVQGAGKIFDSKSS